MTQGGQEQTEWSPPSGGIAGCALVGAALAISAVTVATDAPGRVLAGIAGVGLLVFAGFSWRARPKLALTFDGLAVRGWWRTRVLTPDSLTRLRVTEYQRIGRKHRLLEIETRDDQMLILSRWDLGTDPRDVFEALSAAGYTGR
ncbi:PH domain-containing protein [Mycolicibacter heraklionensis]|uniref:PH domain-containing protein n=1 Tax=Mycolicibacter heraklionensis TaxID=512402 RepID=A0A9X7WGH1_9MYCO|nr:PH domain-containing protein [Mycolicibacter heraklionensis]QZA07811.1 PH domain-containing protein [Mycolicibacter heraklionensis]